MPTIKVITKFLSEQYGIDYNEAILKIYNDENDTCLKIIKNERKNAALSLRDHLEYVDNNTQINYERNETNQTDKKVNKQEKIQQTLTDDELLEFIDEYDNDEGITIYSCMKCHKEYKKCGKSLKTHVHKCINE
jgi:hypothetical protein